MLIYAFCAALVWIFCKSVPFLWQGDQHCTVHGVQWTAILYSDPVSFALLSALFPIITSILVSSFDCCWAPTWCFQSTIYHFVKRFPLSNRDHCRDHYGKCEVRIVFFPPCHFTFTYTVFHLPFHCQVSWRLSEILDNWPLPLLFWVIHIINKLCSSMSELFLGPPWIWCKVRIQQRLLQNSNGNLGPFWGSMPGFSHLCHSWDVYQAR